MQRTAPARESAPPRSDIPFDQSIVPASPGEQSQGLAGRAFRGFASWLKGAVIVLGVMYVISWLVVSFAVTAIDSTVWRPSTTANIAERSIAADLTRPYGVAADPRITPEQAGLAFNALQPAGQKGGDFTFRDATNRPVAPWRTWKLDPALFPSARGNSWNGPNNLEILEAVKKGFSRKEKEVLRAIALAPVWHDYDRFARAAAADLIGGRFELPFSPDATAFAMPIARFAATKELAYASVSRAAWHLSEGRRDSAEAVLRTTISFGLAMSDNAAFPIEQLIGNVITGIGRQALGQLYTITGDSRTVAVAAIGEKQGRYAGAVPRELREINDGTLDEKRQRLVTIATTPTFARAIRQRALMDLALSSCTKVGELLTGPNASVRAAFTQARRDLARYPGEAATLDLVENALNGLLPSPDQLPAPNDALVTVAWTIGRVYFNPRLGLCAVMAANLGAFPR